MNARSPGERAALALFRLASRSFPPAYRRRFGHETASVFVETMRSRPSPWSRWRYVLRAVAAALPAGLAERASHRRAMRGNRRRSWIGVTVQDARFAMRSFRRRPGFSLTALGILGLGIGASTAVFSIADAVLIRPLPYPDPDRLIYFDLGSHTGPDYQDWLERFTQFEEIVAALPDNRHLTNEGPAAQVTTVRVTPDFFETFGARPHYGRLFVSADYDPPARLAVLHYDFWVARWGGDSSVVGRSVLLDGVPHEVVGITSPDFEPPLRMVRRVPAVWLPLDRTLPQFTRRSSYTLLVTGRLRPGATLDAAEAEMDAWEDWAAATYPEQYTSSRTGEHRNVPLVPLHDATTRSATPTLYLLLGAVTLMLLIACANVANLFLARGADREREMALRTALGAARSRLVGQLVVESLTLSLLGAVVGVGVATLGVEVLATLSAANVPRLDHAGIDLRALGFAVLVAIATGVAFGIIPALTASPTRGVADALRDGTGRASAGPRHMRFRQSLIVLETTLALVLLTGAGLLFGSFVRLTRVDPGFDPERVVVMSLMFGEPPPGSDTRPAPADRASEKERRVAFTEALVERADAIPGVLESSAGVTLPFAMGGRCCWFTQVTTATAEPDTMRAVIHPVTPRYFDVLGARLGQGRDLRWNDPDSDNGATTVISRTMADRFFPEGDAVGERIRMGSRSPVDLTVIGVVDDLRHWSLDDDEDVDIYVPYGLLAADVPLLNLAVRTTGPVADLGDHLRRIVADLDPNLPISSITPLPRLVADSIAAERFLSLLLLTFAGAALALAAGGIYGTTLYSVTERRREFGIRLALGADAGQLVRLVIRQGLVVSALGIAAGSAVSLALARWLEGFVFGIGTVDIPTFAGVSAMLLAVSVLACWSPARRAARTDPVETLRSE